MSTILQLILCAILYNVNPAPQRHKRGLREPCAETLKTVTTVQSCPTDKESWERQSRLKNCEKVPQNCSTQDFVYHCILDDFGKRLLEVCAPTTEIIGRFCAEFSSGGKFVQEHVEKQCKSCPFAYNSSMSYLYAECYELPESTTYIESTTTTQRKTTQDPPWNLTSSPSGSEEQDAFNSSILLYSILGTFISISFLVFIICKLRAFKKKQPNPDDRNSQPLVNVDPGISSPEDHKSSPLLMKESEII